MSDMTADKYADQRAHDVTWQTAAEREQAECKGCGSPTDRLDLFPGGVCLDCWAQSPGGCLIPTADDVVRMWGGPVRKSK